MLAERLQCLGEVSVEKLIGEECLDVEEILCGGVGIGEEDGGDKRQSVCAGVTIGGDVDVGDRFSRTQRLTGFCGKNWVVQL